MTPGVVDGPPPTISTVLASRHGGNFSFELSWDQAMMMWQPVGGMDQIPVALANAVGRNRITYRAEVLEIANRAGGVTVTYADRSPVPKTLQADYVVCTIPPQILKRIPHNFTAEVAQALDVPAGASTGKIGLQYSRRWWEEDEKIFGGITQTNLDVSTIWYPSYGYLGKGGVVVGYYNFGGNAVAYGNRSHAEREARAVAQGEKIHGPVYRSALQSSFSVAWEKTRFSEGGWVSWPGGRGAAYERLLQPDGNVYFAGDHLSYYTSWQAGAFESARKVVMDLHQRVMAA